MYREDFNLPTRTTTAPATRLLLDAAALLERTGWCKFWREKKTGEHCVLGALDAAIKAKPELKPALGEARRRFRSYLGIWCISMWNDNSTEWRAIQALRNAAQ